MCKCRCGTAVRSSPLIGRQIAMLRFQVGLIQGAYICAPVKPCEPVKPPECKPDKREAVAVEDAEFTPVPGITDMVHVPSTVRKRTAGEKLKGLFTR